MIQRVIIGGSLLILLLLIVYPIGIMFHKSFQEPGSGAWTLQHYYRVFTEPGLTSALGNSLWLGFWVTVLSAVLAIPMALGVSRTDMPLKSFIRASSAATFVIPSFIGVIAWIALLGPNAGTLNQLLSQIGLPRFNIFSMNGLILILTLHLYPLMFHTLASALDGIDPAYEEAASVLGCGQWRRMLAITIPLVTPALVSGAMLVFLDAIALFGAPALIGPPAGFHVLTTKIYLLFKYPPQFELGAAAATPLILFTLLGLGIQRYILGRKSFTTISGKAGRAYPIELGRWRYLVVGYSGLVVLVSLFLPLATIVSASLVRSWGADWSWANTSLHNYRILLQQPLVARSIQNGFILAVGAATACVLIALVITWVVERTQARGRGVLSFLSMITFTFPALVLAVGLLIAFTKPPLNLYGTLWLILFAYVAKKISFAYVFVRNALKQLGSELEEAARILGAPWHRAMSFVTVPLLKGGMTAAWLIIFSICLRELSMTVLLYLPGSETMAVAIYNFLEDGVLEQAAAIAVLIVVLSVAAVYAVRRLAGRGVHEVE